MDMALFRDKLQPRSVLGIWLPIILIEICLAAVGVLFPLKPMIIIFIAVPLVYYLFSNPFHAYLFALLMLPFWELTLYGVGEVKGQIDIRYTQIATAIALLSWLYNGLISKKLSFEKYFLLTPIAILVFWMLLSFIWAVNVYLGIKEFLQVVYGVSVFLLTINNVKDEKTLNTVLKTWIVVGLLCALSGMYELIAITIPAVKKLSTGTITFWGPSVRVSAMKETPHRVGFILNVCLLIIVPQFVISQSKKFKAYLVFCISTAVVIIISTMSRSTWIACFYGVTCCSFYSKRLAKTLIISCVAVILLYFLLAPESLQHAITERFKGVLDPLETSSIEGRSSVWTAGIEMFRQRPLIGVGIGSFSVLAAKFGSEILDAPHDVYVFFLAEFGLIGVTIFLALIATNFLLLIRGLRYITNDANKFVLFGLFIGLSIYFLQGLVVSYKFIEMEIWALLGLATVALKVFTTAKDRQADSDAEHGVSAE